MSTAPLTNEETSHIVQFLQHAGQCSEGNDAEITKLIERLQARTGIASKMSLSVDFTADGLSFSGHATSDKHARIVVESLIQSAAEKWPGFRDVIGY